MTHERGEEPISGRQPPIGDYAVIGDCRTMALVSKAGSIDWLCLPRFDGGSVFAALLDEERGGRFLVRPLGTFDASRRYLPDTNVLETTFRTPGGAVRLTDLMPVNDPHRDGDRPQPDHEVLRLIECLDGEVEIEVVCDPRFDYGRLVPRGREMGRLGIHFDGGADDLMLHSDVALSPRHTGLRMEGRHQAAPGRAATRVAHQRMGRADRGGPTGRGRGSSHRRHGGVVAQMAGGLLLRGRLP